jgi:hypothetical protein
MKGRTDLVVGKVLLDIGASLVMKSPVGDATLWQSPPPAGYAGGRFRGNWQYGFGSAPTGDLPDIDPSGDTESSALSNVSCGRIREGIKGHKISGIHYIANNLPYAQALEDGHSTQAPAPLGIVMRTMIEFPGIVKRAQA